MDYIGFYNWNKNFLLVVMWLPHRKFHREKKKKSTQVINKETVRCFSVTELSKTLNIKGTPGYEVVKILRR